MVNYSQFNTKEMQMTNYDIFMMNKNKKKAESKLFGRNNDIPADISYENYKKKFIKENDSDEYKMYLMEQLERKSPERILPEEEFYSAVKIHNKTRSMHKNEFRQRVKTHKENRPSFMSVVIKKLLGNVEIKKGGKFFIAFYVLIVIAVASILIVMNTSASSKLQTADAVSGENTTETVQPMVLDEEEDTDQNWFDKMCDSLNK